MSMMKEWFKNDAYDAYTQEGAFHSHSSPANVKPGPIVIFFYACVISRLKFCSELLWIHALSTLFNSNVKKGKIFHSWKVQQSLLPLLWNRKPLLRNHHSNKLQLLFFFQCSPNKGHFFCYCVFKTTNKLLRSATRILLQFFPMQCFANCQNLCKLLLSLSNSDRRFNFFLSVFLLDDQNEFWNKWIASFFFLFYVINMVTHWILTVTSPIQPFKLNTLKPVQATTSS